MNATSPALLRAILRPSTAHCSHVRHSSSWMPRERFAKTTRLDKLHRRQKANNRIERQSSEKRALAMPPLSFATHSPTSQTSSSQLLGDLTSSPLSTTLATPSSSSAPSTLPYFVHRTKTKNYPVYESHKAGGSKHITTIRKCAGDLEALQQHLTEALKLEPSFVDPKGNKKYNVVIKQLTNQIVVRGWRGPEIKKWCSMAGF